MSLTTGGGPRVGVNGAWGCMRCHNVNYAQRMQCFRCHALREYPEPVQMVPVASVVSSHAAFAAYNLLQSFRHDANPVQAAINYILRLTETQPHWFLHGSTMTNPPTQPTQGPAKSKRSGPPIAGENGNWMCNLCSNVNFAQRQRCNRCGARHESSSSSFESADLVEKKSASPGAESRAANLNKSN
mmetsp:Transcript_16530/g.23204  ORF Transcript_16530/g.23204 Transcript_16530/m.23204 type:complete len:186 (-) Transcript_16530:170-727(-)